MTIFLSARKSAGASSHHPTTQRSTQSDGNSCPGHRHTTHRRPKNLSQHRTMILSTTHSPQRRQLVRLPVPLSLPLPMPLLLLLALTLCGDCARLASAGAITTTAATASARTTHDTEARAAAVAEAAPTTTQATMTRPAGGTAIAADERQRATQLGLWGTARSIWHWLRSGDLFEKSLWTDDDSATTASGRTFGKIRRLQMALIPIIFKFGVLSAMVAFLVLLGLKTLFLLKLLVLMNAAAILGKFITLKANFGHQEYVAPVTWGHVHGGWSPSGWSAPAPQHHPSKEIHLHIHGGGQPSVTSGHSTYGNYGGAPVQTPQGWERRSDPYAAYDPAPGNEKPYETNEWNSAAPVVAPPANYLSNHRMY